jgi:UDP-N-acetyl-D-glucosamine dehydrogenase
MPAHVVDLIRQALGTQGKTLRGAKVLLLGVAFKSDVEDARNTPAQHVTTLLLEEGAEVSYHDPYVLRFESDHTGPLRAAWTRTSVPLDADLVASQDCVVVLVRHRCVDYQTVVKAARLVVDTVNATGEMGDFGGKFIRLGAGKP